MSLLEIARTTLDPRRGGQVEVLMPYETALSRAVTLAPTFRADRAAYEAIAPCRETPALSPLARHITAVVITLTAAVIGWVAVSSPSGVALAAAFGLVAAVSGDRLGSAARHVDAFLSNQMALAAVAAIELTALSAVAAVAAEDVLPGLALLVLGIAAAAVGYATRTGDAEADMREQARRTAQRKFERSEQAIRAALSSLRSAHAADLTRIASEMGHPPAALLESGKTEAAR
ncbi:hypothetical protein [Blastochloris sulfoviridis]|uniref:Uncharacterized protein n=1 Tax=Blastochloris sulfoviridis TaxID=50712 RepID=A0A5M6HQR0_9HYPH|nr:hypothetical protein [Blastochloris sulfoviridis]KAA5598203.1 hypothetical protein F1193_13525 [Blastochloris sulfoviridis]